mgnify:CR=1 FL=1
MILLRLVGDILFCTGFLSYQGPFNQDFRLLLAKDWQKALTERNIPFTRTLNVTEYLSDVTMVSEWKLQGLPNDELVAGALQLWHIREAISFQGRN